MKYSERLAYDMRKLVADNMQQLESDALIAKFTVLASYYNDYFQLPVFSLKKSDIKKHIQFYAKKIQS